MTTRSPRSTRRPGQALRPSIAAAAIAAGTLALGACAQRETASTEGPSIEPPRAYADPPVWDPGDRPVTRALDLAAVPPATPAALVSARRIEARSDADAGVEPAVIGANAGELMRVKLSTNRARAREVIDAILGEYLGRSYVLDPSIEASNQTVTVDIDEEMTRAEIAELFGALARLYGWSITEHAGVTTVAPAAQMARSPLTPVMRARAAFESEMPAIRVRRLRHIAPGDAEKLLRDLVSNGGKIVSTGRTLVMLDTVRQLNRLSDVLAAVDVPPFDGVEIWTYALGHRTPREAAELLEAIAGGTRLAGTADPLITVLPMPGPDRLLVISRDPSLQPLVTDLVRQVDAPGSEQRRGRYIYRIQYFEPTALVQLVTSFFADRVAGAGPNRPTQPDTDPNAMRLVLEPKENLLLIQATPEDYRDLLATLREIDRPRQQVVLHSVIAEVTLSGRLEFGVDYFLNALDEDGIGILDLTGAANTVVGATGTVAFTAADGLAIIQALATETDVDVLSQPKLTARDGEIASIQVGGRTPVSRGDVDTETGGLRREIDYEDIGVILEITPDINESGDVTLAISQEITDVLEQGDLGPEFTTRNVKTSVTVPHGRTLIIGGIIERRATDARRKIPLLGDIPIAGLAFQSQTKITERRELLLAVTPRIVNSPAAVDRTVSDFLAAARGVRAALHREADSLQQGLLDADKPALPPRPAIDPYAALAPSEPPATSETDEQSAPPDETTPLPGDFDRLPAPLRDLLRERPVPRPDPGTISLFTPSASLSLVATPFEQGVASTLGPRAPTPSAGGPAAPITLRLTDDVAQPAPAAFALVAASHALRPDLPR